jgi:hypothetical protein
MAVVLSFSFVVAISLLLLLLLFLLLLLKEQQRRGRCIGEPWVGELGEDTSSKVGVK